MAEVGKVCLLPTEEMFSFSDLYAPFFFECFSLLLRSCFFLATGVPNSIDFRARSFELFATLLSLFSPCCCCCSGALRFVDLSVRAFASA